MTEPTRPVSNTVVVCATAIILTVIGLGGWVAYNGGDVERTLGWVGTQVGGLVPLIALLVRVSRVGKKVDDVRHQTNGTMSLLLARMDALEQGRQPDDSSAPGTPYVTPDDAGIDPSSRRLE